MKRQWTILRVVAAVFTVGVVLFAIIHWKNLSSSEGWGVVAMSGLFVLGLCLLLLDAVLQTFIRDARTVNIVGIILLVALGASVLFLNFFPGFSPNYEFIKIVAAITLFILVALFLGVTFRR